jgi:glycosyltransferase involved in cell wall biosynthesis
MSCVLAMTRKPLVVSLNGSDVNGTQSHSIFKNFKAPIVILISMIIQFCADFIICKSPQIHRRIHKTNSAVIPNGVDLNRYKEVSYDSEHSSDSFKILFLGNPKDTNKNIQLLIDAVDLIGDERIKVIAPYRVPNQEIPNYLASANMLAHCSFKEGSSNVIKEAMACNLPIVATDAGDSWWLLGDLDGHYKTDFDPQSYASCIREIMKNRKATRGRERLIELGLESSTVAQKIISIYLNALRGHNPRSPEI